MSRPLKIWNGGGHGLFDRGHLYVCATTKRDAAIMLVQATRRGLPPSAPVDEFDIGRQIRVLNVYFHEGCWGNPMDDITPERGVWATKTSHTNEKPERII
jgi:hypothetical protein